MSDPIPLKWNYEEYRRVICSNKKVSNQDVSDIVDWAIKNIMTVNFRLWSGVHGEPIGIISVEDEEFYKTDKRNLTLKTRSCRVKVHQMFWETMPPEEMRVHLRDPTTTVILGWCYSEGFIPTGFQP
ncbi:Toxin with a H, D/N and C signature [Sphingomonas sp. NFR04]|uniref:hypothetical protein n=1 Tax=Sphingomonas sp. NFR04 TaxID=1566283 RepID=UPI0008E0C3D1|nr:hypothetical protein [Sphingomonas sp. NFR04]SFJ24695.1 Toxin with a H, D/N and C signature [Sphingomonas sp. NFR04]